MHLEEVNKYQERNIIIGVASAIVLTAVIIIIVALTDQQTNECAPGIRALNNAGTVPGYCAFSFAQDLNSPRGIITADNGDILVVDASTGSIIALWDENQDGRSDKLERVILARADGLNHGIAIGGGYLYAASQTTVYRWPFTSGTRTDLGQPEIVIGNIPPEGRHITRSLAVDAVGNLFVSIGSATNVDATDDRAAIRRFKMPDQMGSNWKEGTVFASGLRNAVGMRIDKDGNLWAVDNGVDELTKDGNDIHNDNPAEEINFLGNSTSGGGFYGYPYCWTEYRLRDGKGPGSQWVAVDFQNDGIHSNDWCQNPSNVIKPALVMPAHIAPLDILFYYGKNFPRVDAGDAFVSWHGSWNRDPPRGYKVVHISYVDGMPKNFEPFLFFGGNGYVEGETDRDTGDGWPYRPVGLAISKCAVGTRKECLYITSDSTGDILAVSWVSPGGEGTY